MKALVLSRGAGTRLRGSSLPEELVPVANKPVLEHGVENLRDIGITEIGVVVGEAEHEIAEVLGDGTRLGVSITYLRHDASLGLAHSVRIARPFLGDDDFVLYLCDNVIAEGIGHIADEFARLRPSAHVLVGKVEDPRLHGVAEVDENSRVTRLVERPRESGTDLALIGVYFFTPAIHAAVDAVEPSFEIIDAVQWLVTHERDVRAHVCSGFWKHTGTVEDLLECNRELLMGLRTDIRGLVDSESRLIGEVVVEEGARVVRSCVVGPAIIGPGTLVEESIVGPYTSIGADCRITTSGVADSVVLNEASVHDVSGIEKSVIGSRARVRFQAAA
ncbi:glucose-1-phosphate thymidylyltransferase [Lentzea flava]|uniref:Glucose-1-phosphate thymidylyltransferase n=1 Tax=Lentzea flava TaxID=103732 RepID=A0ABQ2V7F0_9PSEU|nr:glucose-1-phosphate thymidylyltransferase [Lentzea flava]MCP2203779.1 glucose-1-phosphate thymidylyltransferase [Lentzea flava]GGU71700.1 glucose-1-phosphate thymidylyltransferase [Lentzea flava]